MSTLTLSTYDIPEIARLPQAIRDDLNFWFRMFEQVMAEGGALSRAYASVASRHDLAAKTLERRFLRWKKTGDWRDVADRRHAPELWKTTGSIGLTPDFIEHWKSIQQRYQRNTTGRAAWRALIRSWQSGESIPGYRTPPVADPMTGIPRGWSYENLSRYKLTKFESTAVRIGRSTASAQLPKVLSTRVNILPGQIYVLDDQEYDVQVAAPGIARRMMRPKGFNALDYSTACDFSRGYKPVIINPDGSRQALRQIDFEWFLVKILTTIGYREDTGTLIVGEHGTAKAGKDFFARVQAATGGKVTWDASGIHGEQICGMFRGSPRGNPRFKAARESLFRLFRSEMAALPGPSGQGRAHAPEESYGLDIYTRQLLEAIIERPALVEKLQFPVLTWSDFLFAAEDIAQLINDRRDHELEGWERMGRIVGEWRLSLDHPWTPASSLLALPAPQRELAETLIRQTAGRWKMRRLAPWECWQDSLSGLTRITGAAIPILLGPDAARPATVNDEHTFLISDEEIDPEPMSYDAALHNGRILDQGSKCLVYLNPFLPDELQVCDAAGRWLGTAPRVHRLCKLDTDGLRHRYGEVRRIESKLLAPIARRGAAKAKERADMHNHNTRALNGQPITAEEKEAAKTSESRRTRAVAALANHSQPHPVTHDNNTDY